MTHKQSYHLANTPLAGGWAPTKYWKDGTPKVAVMVFGYEFIAFEWRYCPRRGKVYGTAAGPHWTFSPLRDLHQKVSSISGF